MKQAMDSDTENRAWLSPVLQEARQFRNMNIHQHANLVQAIMLNFPEIYELDMDAEPASAPRPQSPPGVRAS